MPDSQRAHEGDGHETALQQHRNRTAARAARNPSQLECAYTRKRLGVRELDVIATWNGRLATALRTALRLSIEGFAEHLGVAARTVAYWDARPDVVPKPDVQQLLDLSLTRASSVDQARFALILTDLHGGPGATAAARKQPDNSFVTAARQSTADTIDVVQRVGSDSVELQWHRLTGLARAYGKHPLEVEFEDADAIRSQVVELARRTARPTELADLYVIAGAASALMASVAFDLDRWHEAGQLVKVATTYADSAGHTSLAAWTLGLQATLAFWENRPLEALTHVERGLALAPSHTAVVRLNHIGARAAAIAGDRDRTADLLLSAEQARERTGSTLDHMADEIGGEFAFDQARADACATAAWLALGDGEQVEAAARSALERYAELDEQPTSPVLGTRIDLAAARLLRGDSAGAAAELETVIAAGSANRVSLSGRMNTVRRILDDSRWTRNRVASGLRLSVDEWFKQASAARPSSV